MLYLKLQPDRQLCPILAKIYSTEKEYDYCLTSRRTAVRSPLLTLTR